MGLGLGLGLGLGVRLGLGLGLGLGLAYLRVERGGQRRAQLRGGQQMGGEAVCLELRAEGLVRDRSWG